MDIFKFVIYGETSSIFPIVEWYEEVNDCVALIRAVNRQFNTFQKYYPDLHHELTRMDINFCKRVVSSHIRFTNYTDTPSEG